MAAPHEACLRGDGIAPFAAHQAGEHSIAVPSRCAHPHDLPPRPDHGPALPVGEQRVVTQGVRWKPVRPAGHAVAHVDPPPCARPDVPGPGPAVPGTRPVLPGTRQTADYASARRWLRGGITLAAAGKRQHKPEAAEQAHGKDADQYCCGTMIDIAGHEQHRGGNGKPHRCQAADRHDVGGPDEALLLMTAEDEAVIGDWPEQQGGRQRRQHQAGDVELALGVTERREPGGERKREQEAEEHLDAEASDPEFLQQFSKVTVVALGFGLGARVIGSRGCGLGHSRASSRPAAAAGRVQPIPCSSPARAVTPTIVVSSPASVPSAAGASVGTTYTAASRPSTDGASAVTAGPRAAGQPDRAWPSSWRRQAESWRVGTWSPSWHSSRRCLSWPAAGPCSGSRLTGSRDHAPDLALSLIPGKSSLKRGYVRALSPRPQRGSGGYAEAESAWRLAETQIEDFSAVSPHRPRAERAGGSSGEHRARARP